MLPVWRKEADDSPPLSVEMGSMSQVEKGREYFGGRQGLQVLAAVRKEADSITCRFTQQSSLHGLQYIGSPVNAGLRRLFYACCFVASVAFFLNAVIPRLKEYLRNPVLTKISIERAHAIRFPAVTLCNFNPYRKSVIEKDPNVAAIVQSAYKSSSSEYIGLAGINQSDPAINHTLHTTVIHNVVVEAAHPLIPMFWNCEWQAEQVYCDDYFTTMYTDFGICYTFNSEEYIKKHGSLVTNASGIKDGLILRLNVQHEEYYLQNPISNSAGFRMMLHDPETLPLVKEYGMAVMPGTENFLGIRQVKHSFLPPPYENSKCRETTGSEFTNPLAFYNTYSYSACRYECLANYTLEKCGCRGALMPGPGEYCTMYEYFACELTMEREYSREEDPILRCNCFIPCQQIDYDIRLSSAMYPGDHIITSLEKLFGVTEHHIRHNFLEVKIFYEELNYKWIRQAPEYNLQQLIADIGGQAGFCIGASILSIMELGEWMLNMVIGILKTLASRKTVPNVQDHTETGRGK